ncbi:UvrD-helicase domain-containing protein [Deinococcus cavernae]|nr:UvrD-helicase domain-containing protein [Deinococcus cavernae]
MTTEALRAALFALDNPQDELPPLPALIGEFPAWEERAGAAKERGFHYYSGETLYAFQPKDTCWLCVKVNRTVTFDLAGRNFEYVPPWIPAGIREQLGEVRRVWRKPERTAELEETLEVTPDLAEAVPLYSDWYTLLTDVIQRGDRLESPLTSDQLGQLRFIQKNYVTENGHLNRLLNPESQQNLQANLRIIEMQGFTIRDTRGLWVVRSHEQGWRVRRWQQSRPSTVREFTLSREQLPLEQRAWTAENLASVLSFLDSNQVGQPEHPAPAEQSVPVQPKPRPAPVAPAPPTPEISVITPLRSEDSPIPRYRWGALLITQINATRARLEDARNGQEAAKWAGRLEELKTVHGARSSVRSELSLRTWRTTPEKWAAKVQKIAAKQFITFGEHGLWFFKKVPNGFEVLSWDSREPDDVTQRHLTSLVHDPVDLAWPPAELRQLLSEAHQVLTGDSPLASEPTSEPARTQSEPPEMASGSPVVTEPVSPDTLAVSTSRREGDTAWNDTSRSGGLPDLRPLLQKAIETSSYAENDGHKRARRTTTLQLKTLLKHYVATNTEVESVLRSSHGQVELEHRGRFAVRTATELWYLTKGRIRWNVLAWTAHQPNEVQEFQCVAFPDNLTRSLQTLVELLRGTSASPHLSPLEESRREIEVAKQPATTPLPRASWITALKGALHQVERGLYSPQPVKSRAEAEDLLNRLTWVQRAMVNKKLLLPARIDHRRSGWRESFLQQYGKQFTVQTATGLCVFQASPSGWKVFHWESAVPGEVAAIQLNAELAGSQLDRLPSGVTERLEVARKAFQIPTPSAPEGPQVVQPAAVGSLPTQPEVQRWERLVSTRLDLLDQMGTLPEKLARKQAALRIMQECFAAPQGHLTPMPVDQALQAGWRRTVERCTRKGAFTLLTLEGADHFVRNKAGWQVYSWVLERHGEVTERQLNLDLLDPEDDTWPPTELEEWLDDLALVLNTVSEEAVRVTESDAAQEQQVVPPQADWLSLVETAWKASGTEELQLVQRVLADQETWLPTPPAGEVERVTWEDHVYELGLSGEFGLVGEQCVWVFQRHQAEEWLVHEWHPLVPRQVRQRLLNADFLDEEDQQWPPPEVERVLEECAFELQGLPREKPFPKVAMWGGGGFRLFVSVAGDLKAEDEVGPLELRRGEEPLAAVLRHMRDGGILWAPTTGQEADSIQSRLTEHTVRTDILLSLLTGQPLQAPPQKVAEWRNWLAEHLTALRRGAQQAPAWQQHLLRGWWGLPQTDIHGEAFFEHIEALGAYLDVPYALQLDEGDVEQRLALLAVLSWLTRLDEEGASSRFPFFDLHPQTYAVARAIAHPPISTASQLARRVKSRFGLEVKGEQLQAIVNLTERPGVHLFTLPTGGGKSLVYWTVADVLADLGGTTVVVSPLQALISDQVRAAQGQGFRVASLTGNRDLTARLATLDAYRRGEVTLLYVTPEQLSRHDVQQALLRCPPDLWVFDEAHTLTQWGTSFRPSYQQAITTVLSLSHESTRVLLTSATITSEEQQALGQLFAHLGQLQVTGSAFSLPSTLQIDVQPIADENARLAAMYEALEGVRLARQQAIVYCATPSQAKALAERLATFYPNQNIGVYHGQMSAEQRQQTEADFVNKRHFCLVATSAFGLGVNNPDVRLVIHAYPPASVEDYVQQVGRATRQEEPARALLLCHPRDLEIQFRLQAQQLLQREDYRRVFTALREQSRTLLSGSNELWLSSLEVALLSRLEGETAQQRLKGELALHRLASEGVIRFNTLSPTPLVLSDTTDELSDTELPKVSDTAAEVWQHLNRPTCDPASVQQLVSALGLDPGVLLTSLCELQDAGYLKFDYPIRVFINKGTKVAGMRLASQRLFEAQAALLAYLRTQEAENRTYRLPLGQVLNLLNEQSPLSPPWQRSDVQASLRLWELLGWGEAHLPDYASTVNVNLYADIESAQFETWLNEAQKLATATAKLVDLLYSKTRSAGRQLHLETGYQEINAAVSGLVSPVRLLNLLHRLRLLTLASGSDLRALAQTIEYLPNHQRTLQNLDYAALHLDNARRFARVHLVEAMLGSRDGMALRAFVEEYFATPLAVFFERHLGMPLKSAPPCRREELDKIQALSPAQAKIVSSSDRALLVVSGPGSGKTRTVVHRVAHLLRVERIPATRILVVAFNRAAVRELRQRLFKLVGAEAHDLDIYTFHALALRILNVNLTDLARETGQSKGEALSQALATALQRLQSEDQVDGEERALLESFRGRYDYILIDEYQDIDRAQYELVRLLVGHGQGEDREKARYNLWAVGDDDQTLYQFRGARPEFLQQFESEYETRRQVLVDNYRSLPGITEVSNHLISRSTARTKIEPEEQVRPVRSSVPGQAEVLYHELHEDTPRAFIVNEILHLLKTNPSFKPEDIAVLAPRWVDLAPTWATLKEIGIPAQLLRSGTALPPFHSTHVQAALAELNRRATGLRSGYLLHKEVGEALERASLGGHAPGIRRMLLAGQQLDEERRLTGLLDKPVLVKSLVHELQELLIEPEAIDEGLNGVTFSTFHSAKGLEFKVVFVVGSRPFYSKKQDRRSQWEADLRSYYVAMTRAEELLYLVDKPRQTCEFIPKPGDVPSLGRAPVHPQQRLPTEGTIQMTFDHYGDLHIGHRSTITRRVQGLLTTLEQRPHSCDCEIVWQYNPAGRHYRALEFFNESGKLGALSQAAARDLLQILPMEKWKGASVQLLEATTFTPDDATPYLVPIIELQLRTGFL